MHIHSKVQGWGGSSRSRHLAEGHPALPACCTLQARLGVSKPQLWTGHPSPRFRNEPHHATTARPLSQDPSTLYDGSKGANSPLHRELLSRCKCGHVRWGSAFVSFLSTPALTVSCQRIRGLKELCPPGQYPRHLGDVEVAVDNTRALEACAQLGASSKYFLSYNKFCSGRYPS